MNKVDETLPNIKEHMKNTYINGIIDILFFISIILSIKYTSFIFCSLVISGVAIIVNVRFFRAKRKNVFISNL